MFFSSIILLALCAIDGDPECFDPVRDLTQEDYGK